MRKKLYVSLSVLCAVSVFIMSSVFQSMAHWGKGLTWYWVGVTFTCFIWLLGIIFLVIATRKSNVKEKSIFGLSIMGIVSFIMLICGFCWVAFVIMAGLSGM
ncbi:hypothetical protein GT022_08430 [Agaribacter marinus]|uniref:Uncharacterized protein n=1 Tax=Virgibacillus salarius TaxID=447199 RepID=A0A941DZ91_9BACI|nr:hypothetical protein [Virgibacillus salarius]MBR7796073.1 hypothetical protein [Virgibacillus salarius]NAZ08784.1 hypothetical protein [Agaribacter marinus]